MKKKEYKFKYEGSFDYFCEMGGNPSLMFKDKMTKYLQGYSELDMCYFIKFEDSFVLNDNLVTFTIDINKNNDYILAPKDISTEEWNNILKSKRVELLSKKELYKNLIIIDSNMEDELLKKNLNRILSEDNISKNHLKMKKELLFFMKDNSNIIDYMRDKKYYSLSAYEVLKNGGSIIE